MTSEDAAREIVAQLTQPTGGYYHEAALVERIAAAIDTARREGAMEEAARHADCCVDREERDAARREEREACAALVESVDESTPFSVIALAAAIRARGTTNKEEAS